MHRTGVCALRGIHPDLERGVRKIGGKERWTEEKEKEEGKEEEE